MTQSLTRYAIQHLPTGRLLPNPRGRGGRGGTFTEFSDAGPPRLFEKRSSAESALHWWLKGKIIVGQSDFFDLDVDETWTTVPQAHRKANECAVVEVKIQILKPAMQRIQSSD